MNKKHPLNATTLRCLAMGLMLLDHLWATVVPGNNWMTMLGRLAFPIFAFQTAQGYRHTGDFGRYCRRLLLFGLISELPFNLMISGSLLYPFHQNVLFTLLLGLLAMRQFDMIRVAPSKVTILRAFGKLIIIGLGGILLFPDYGLPGIITVVCFHLLRDFPGSKAAQFAAIAAIHIFAYEGQTIPLPRGLQFPIQGFAVLALIPIWLYNGEKGAGGKCFRLGSYIFYPLHMLLLGLMSYL